MANAAAVERLSKVQSHEDDEPCSEEEEPPPPVPVRSTSRKETHRFLHAYIGQAIGGMPKSQEKGRFARSSVVMQEAAVQTSCFQFIRPYFGRIGQHSQRYVLPILTSYLFDPAIGLIICANAVTVGLDQQFRLDARPPEYLGVQVLIVLENIFLCIYIIELLMRVGCVGCACFKDNWVKFDLVLVLSSVGNSWILEPLAADEEEGQFGLLMVLRTGRLLRLARTVRLLKKFEVLWMMVQGLLSSASTMFYTLVLLLIILYLFTCIGFELITFSLDSDEDLKGDTEYVKIVDEWFPNLYEIMLTLLQFVCLDSVGSIYRPLALKNKPLVIYFVGIILVVPIVLMNLVTAVIVNIALEQAENDRSVKEKEKEEQRQKFILELSRIFMALDDDGSETVSKDEISRISSEDKKMLSSMTNVDDPQKIFTALDVNMDGELGIEEFCEGIYQVAISKTPLEMKRMEIQVDHIHRTLQTVLREQAAQRQMLERGFRHEQTSIREGLELFETSFLRKISGDDGSPRLTKINAFPDVAAGEASRMPDAIAAPKLTAEELACGYRQVCMLDDAKPCGAAEALPPVDNKELLTSRGVVDTSTIEQAVGRACDPSFSAASVFEVVHKHTAQLLTDMAASTKLHAKRLLAIEQEVLEFRLMVSSDVVSGDLFRLRKQQPQVAPPAAAMPPTPADGGIECPPPPFTATFNNAAVSLDDVVAPDLETNAGDQIAAPSRDEDDRRGTKAAI